MGHVNYIRYLTPICGGLGCPPPVSPPVPGPPPAGIPALVGSPAGARAGSYWVEGSEWHFIASNGQEWRGTGDAIATPPGAVGGSWWVEGENFHYIDGTGIERRLQSTSMGAKNAAARHGSKWVDSPTTAQQQWQWIGGTNRYKWHNGF